MWDTCEDADMNAAPCGPEKMQDKNNNTDVAPMACFVRNTLQTKCGALVH